MNLKIEKRDGIDVMVYADCPTPNWSRPASPDEVALWDRIVELDRQLGVAADALRKAGYVSTADALAKSLMESVTK